MLEVFWLHLFFKKGGKIDTSTNLPKRPQTAVFFLRLDNIITTKGGGRGADNRGQAAEELERGAAAGFDIGVAVPTARGDRCEVERRADRGDKAQARPKGIADAPERQFYARHGA